MIRMTQTGTELAIESATDRSSSDQTYQTCARQGIRYAMSILRNQSDAEEAVQEAFCRLQRRSTEGDESAYRGRFFVTLRNHCIDLIRRRTIRKEVRLAQDFENPRASTVQNSENVDVVVAVEDAMSRLPENWRNVLHLRVHGELSYQEIADMTGSSFSQVRTWIYRGRRQLEADLTKSGIIYPNAK